MKFIRFTRSDIQKVRDFDKEHAPLPPQYHIDTVDELNSFFDNPSFVCYGIYQDNQMIGQTSYMKEKEDAYYLNAIVIHKNYRKQGFGSEILKKIMQEVKEKGGKEIMFTVSPLNEGAVAFYKTQGFTVYDLKKDVYGPGSDRLYMKLEL